MCPSSSTFIAASITTTPSLTASPVISPGLPAAPIIMSAFCKCDLRSFVALWQTVSVARSFSNS